jgi:hypothetical protein
LAGQVLAVDGGAEFERRIEELIGAVSHLTPRSREAPHFKISAAAAEMDRTSDADLQLPSAKRAASFLYGTADDLHRARDYLMPVRFDPASNLFGRSDGCGLTKTNGDQANWQRCNRRPFPCRLNFGDVEQAQRTAGKT